MKIKRQGPIFPAPGNSLHNVMLSWSKGEGQRRAKMMNVSFFRDKNLRI
jgi:hypothetical protein